MVQPVDIVMSITSLIGTFVIGFSMLPQTIATLKNKQTANLNLALYILMGIATFFITFYGIALCTVRVDQVNDNSAVLWSGYIVPGIAIIIGELLCTITSFMIASVKIDNMIKAKKAGMSEQQYIDSRVRKVQQSAGVR